MTASATVPAIDWFTSGATPALLGRRCGACGTYHFPPTAAWCANPACRSDRLETVELARRGTVWSYTDARYQPPPPYQPPSGEHVPFAIAAVRLEREGLIILGQVASGYGVDDLSVGTTVEVVTEVLERVEGVDRTVWKWRPVAPLGGGGA
ncbi:OB-fold domain-containing protein [Acidiferrimicrobium sp. IK]|uniref:Zn-ribbon domain-containing OB-fold protein n=1 Tax=Acidiferrimicrobium sp. IK TaxID=2871700 RepID=UPI0021CB946E|nr:OB-fold domain-containing protein [Acidiferrimicrobium sp. IK]MCU4184208.1 OB-fold domain-containing protein [Acidiferrimicrobium sp. IK]